MSDDGVKPPTRRRAIRIEGVEPPTATIIRAGEAAVEAESEVFESTQPQREARARLHLELRDGPQQANALTVSELITITQEPRITGWMRKRGFREWLVGQLETEVQVEAAYMAAVELLSKRVGRGVISDKDLINTVKLLAEIANKMPKKWENTKVLDADVGRMSDDERIRLMVDTLRRIGYQIGEVPRSEPNSIDGARDSIYGAETGDGSGSGGPDAAPGTTTPSAPSNSSRD